MEQKQAFTCIGRGHGAPCRPATREDWEKARKEPWLAAQCDKIRRLEAEGAIDDIIKGEKAKLWVWTPHCAEFRGNHRATADAVRPLPRLMLDFDEKGHTEDIMRSLTPDPSPVGEGGGSCCESSRMTLGGLTVLLIEESVRRGTHVLVELPEGMTAEEAQQLMREATGFTPDAAVKDVARCIYMVPDSCTKYISERFFQTTDYTNYTNSGQVENTKQTTKGEENSSNPSNSLSKRTTDYTDYTDSGQQENMMKTTKGEEYSSNPSNSLSEEKKCFKGIPYSTIIAEYWRRTGGEPVEGERNVKLYQLAVNLRAICDNKKAVLMAVMPRFGLNETELQGIVDSACKESPKGISKMMQEIIKSLASPDDSLQDIPLSPSEGEQGEGLFPKKLPQGIRDSIDAVGPQLAMPVVTAICPCIGALATGVVLDVHNQKKGLNLIAYIAGDFASGKGQIDPVVEAWMSEVKALDIMYQMQEDEWRAKKRAAKNKKEQPEEPKLPVRCLTLNNTVANLAERLANTEGKHAFSFTPEADTVAQKWKTAMSDFSIMLRQSYDGTSYEREARSAEAVNVHIKRLLWNVTMCGTPDALYRVVSNYTDGFQSRIAVARTPDNTFSPLEEKPYVLTDRQRERIQQVAHLLPLMQGEVTLPKLEARGRQWLEKIRLETMMNDDKVRARQRFRVCVTAQRMTCCLMLCKVCETLIQKHGLNGAETLMKQQPNLWKEMLMKAQTPQMLGAYDVVADSLLENALHFFRDRIENAFSSRDYAGFVSGERLKRGKNDSIYGRLDMLFTFEQAMQHAVAVKGAGVTHNSVRQMLKNWRKQGLVEQTEDGRYRKMNNDNG